ncbi:MAG TPA: hypothetical protein VMV49_17220 [Candidatus Deferrimicrobium sp.]|nr:hypothetical protein [Candidatus Deferrimicrobium sp.]
MLQKFFKRKEFFSALLLFLICFPSFVLFISNHLNNNSSAPHSNTLLNEPAPPFYSQMNLTPTGNGKTYNCYENAWGSKSYLNLNGTSSLAWETPGAWIGQRLSVSITNLTEILPGEAGEFADSRTTYSGTYVNGSVALSLITIGGVIGEPYLNYEWDETAPLNYTLTFNTGIDRSRVFRIEIHTWSYSTHSGSPLRPVSYYLRNYNSGGYQDSGVDAPEDSFNWAFVNLTSGFTDYISASRQMQVNFYALAAQNNELGEYHLDYIRIYFYFDSTTQLVTPAEVGLVLNDGMTNHAVQGSTGSGSVSITGSWTADPKYFQFSAPGHNILFNATSTFWAYQNKPNTVSSTYYLNQSQPNPAQHLWKLDFVQDNYPSANFTKFNFTISTIPKDWAHINATDPSSSLQTLDEIIGASGKTYAADDGDITGSGTWELYFASPNYISGIQLRKNAILLPENPALLIWDTLNIRSMFASYVVNADVNLTVSFEGKINKSAEITSYAGTYSDFPSWKINSTTNKNGIYIITTSFFNETEIGIYSTLITVIFPTKISIISPLTQNFEFLKGDPINLTIYFENIFYPGNYYNEKGINSSIVTWIISNSTGYNQNGTLLNHFEGYYNSTINTGTLDIIDGEYQLTVLANKTIYQNQSSTFTIYCFQSNHPTNAVIIISSCPNLQRISDMNYTAGVYPNQSITIQLNYTDIFSIPRLIDYAAITASLHQQGGGLVPGYPVQGVRTGLAKYSINISNLEMPLAHYQLIINLSKLHYLNSSIYINYTIKQLDATIKVSKLYSTVNISTPYIEWEHLDISFKIEYRTTIYYQFTSSPTSVYWGMARYIIVPATGNPLNPVDIIKTNIIGINASGIFEIKNLLLSNGSGQFAPGEYKIYIVCNATDCQERWFNFNLTIRKKLNTTLTITSFPSKIIIDQKITIKAKLSSTELGDPIYFNQKEVFFNITLYYTSYAPFTFTLEDRANQYGDVEVEFFIETYTSEYLDDVDHVEILLYFNGYEVYYTPSDYSFYSCSTGKIIIPVSTPLNFMFLIYIVLGVVGGIAAVYIVYRKVIVPKDVQKSKSISYLFTSFKDVVGLQNIFVLLKSTGDSILNRTYSPEGIDESMEKVLCNVIANYNKGDQRNDAFCDLVRFENFMLLIDDGEYIRTAVTVGQRPSDKLIRSLVRFVQFFEMQNYSTLKNATGPIHELSGVNELLDIQFGASLIAPYTISKIKKISGFEDTIMLMAMGLMKEHNYFFLSQLYGRAKNETLVDEMMIFKTIQDLMDKQIIMPYIPTKTSTDLSQKLARTEYDRLKVEIVSAKNKALKAFNEGRYEQAAECYREAAGLVASMGDVAAKDKFLEKMKECNALIKPKKPTEMEIPIEEIPAPIPEEIPESAPAMEEIEPLTIERQKPAEISEIKKITVKSEDLIESPEPSEAFEPDYTEDELTPFEKAIISQEQAKMKGTDLLEEEQPVSLDQEYKIEEPIQEEYSPALTEEFKVEPEKEQVVSPIKEEISIEELMEVLSQEPLIEKETPQQEPLPMIEQELPEISSHEIEQEPLIEEVPVIEPISKQVITPFLTDNEIKIIKKIIQESEKNLKNNNKEFDEIEKIAQELQKTKESNKEKVQKTSTYVSDRTKGLIQHLLIPRKSIDEEVEIAQIEIDSIVKEIDKVDQETVRMKKEITSLQKQNKKLKEELEKTNEKISTISNYLNKTTPDELETEKEQLISLNTNYADQNNRLEVIEKDISALNKEIVNLMIEDIEQMMVQQQKAEKVFSDTTKKLKDTNKVKEAFLKENSKLKDEKENLERVVSLAETISKEIKSQITVINTEYETFEQDFQKKIDSIIQAIQTKTRDPGSFSAEFHILNNRLKQNIQNMGNIQDKIEKTIKDLEKADKTSLKITKHKDAIYHVIEKTTELIYPEAIQTQRAFITEFLDTIQVLMQNMQDLRLNLNTDLKYVTQNLNPKIKIITKKLQDTQSLSEKAAKEVTSSKQIDIFKSVPPKPEIDLFEPAEEKPVVDLFKTDEEEPEPLEIISPPPEKAKPEELTDKDLGFKLHCPYCNSIIPEKTLNLLRKNFEPACTTCGETIKLKDINLD